MRVCRACHLESRTMMKENFLVSCRPDILREEKVGSVSRSEQNFLELAAAVLFEVDLLSGLLKTV